MKILTVLTILLFIISTGFGQNLALERKHGIRDIKLGSPKSSYSDLYKIPSKIKCGEMYRRKNENLYIGEAKVSEIQYLYIKNSLSGIYIVFDNDDDMHSVWKALYSLYGMPTPDEDDTQVHWQAVTFHISATHIPRTLSYIINDFSEKCEDIQNRKIDNLKRQL